MDAVFIIVGIFYAFVTILGVSGNLIMVLAFVMSPKLRSVCHCLICWMCASDLLHCMSQAPNSISIFANWEMKQSTCFFIQLLPVIGAVASSPICLIMGLDRFIAIAFPHFYRWIQQHYIKSLIIYSLFPIGYTAWIVGIAARTKTETLINVCAVPLALSPQSFSAFNTSSLGINIIICSVYIGAWILLRFKKVGNSFQRIFKSILITVLLIVFGWFSTVAINSAAYIVIKDNYVMMVVQMFAGFFVNSSLCVNVFVYYFRNTEYREAIRGVFRHKTQAPESVYTTQRTGPVSEA